MAFIADMRYAVVAYEKEGPPACAALLHTEPHTQPRGGRAVANQQRQVRRSVGDISESFSW